jgi:hypothetical protein
MNYYYSFLRYTKKKNVLIQLSKEYKTNSHESYTQLPYNQQYDLYR